MLKNLIFDWSGTLCDDLTPVVTTTGKIFQKHGLKPLTRAEFLDQFSLPYDKFYAERIPHVPIEYIEDDWKEFFPKDGGEITVIEGVNEFLEEAKSYGFRLFLLSSVPREQFDVQASKFGLSGYFEDHETSVIDKSERMLELLTRNNLVPNETAYVGDMIHDMESAKKCEVTAIGVATGYESADDLHKAGADMIFRNLLEFSVLFQMNQIKQRPIATVGALIYNDRGEVLLVKTTKWSGTWGIPGGKIELNESSEDALRREMLEETNLEICEIHFVMNQDSIEHEQFFKPAHFLLLNYIAKAKTNDVVLNEEAESFVWVPLNKSLEFILNEPTKTLIQKVIKESIIPTAL